MDRLISTFILAQTDSQEQADAAIQDIVKGILAHFTTITICLFRLPLTTKALQRRVNTNDIFLISNLFLTCLDRL